MKRQTMKDKDYKVTISIASSAIKANRWHGHATIEKIITKDVGQHGTTFESVLLDEDVSIEGPKDPKILIDAFAPTISRIILEDKQ